MPHADPKVVLPRFERTRQAHRWVELDLEGGREAAEEHAGTDMWVATDPDGGLLQTLIYLEEAQRRLEAIKNYCSVGTQSQVTEDVAAMARSGTWGKPIGV